MFKLILTIHTIFFLLLTSCDGIIFNYYPSREGNQPLDGSLVSVDFTGKIYYPVGNLNYIKNNENRDNRVYFASAKLYNDAQYNISNEYLEQYGKLLKVDAEELDNQLKNEQFNINSAEIVAKMENGTFMPHPMKGNILAMQNLKDSQNKIAYPDYLDEYIDVYVDGKNKIDKTSVNNEKNTKRAILYINSSTRDRYVDYYLAWNEEYSGNNEEQYFEKPIE